LSDLIADLDRLARGLLADAALIPLQRRIRSRQAEIAAILTPGVTVRALAVELAKRGVTDRSGEPLSYGHLRVLISRMDRRRRPAPQAAALSPLSCAPALSGESAPQARAARAPDFSRGLFGADLDETNE
jgi:hypothetical protein